MRASILEGGLRVSLLLSAFACIPRDVAAQQINVRARVLEDVNGALATADRGDYRTAREKLERSLQQCSSSAQRRTCRTLYASGLGSVLQREARANLKDREALYMRAVAYYDTILQESPNNAEALYGKAIAYRELGPHEWQESFFTAAASRDITRSTLYLTFLGDYYAAAKRWPDAASAYRRASVQDAENEGARTGLVTALAALGATSRNELLRLGQDWERRYASSAANAYRAVLALSFGPTSQPDFLSDAAVVRLVGVQARNNLGVGTVPSNVNPNWTPVREVAAFVTTNRADVAPWWRVSSERKSALAEAALAAGRTAASRQDYARAEQQWRAGVDLADRYSPVILNLRRELALLYFHHPELDPGQSKFAVLEREIFDEKALMLSKGSLEAAQRYHTALGLIYLQRGVWHGNQTARGAERQITWALEKAQMRENMEERFYQPLAELHLVLARGRDSTGDPSGAARSYANAARAFLDADDVDAAEEAANNATRLGEDVRGLGPLLRLRRSLTESAASGAATCEGLQPNSIFSAGSSAFIARQRFKVFADCSRLGSGNLARQRALEAFNLVLGGSTLIGGDDVVRLERVMTAMLARLSIDFEAGHLDAEPERTGPSIMVSLPGETVPFWYKPSPDDVLAVRVAGALNSDAWVFPMSVRGGVVTVAADAAVPEPLIARIRAVPGVVSVQVRP